jgi:hypothetical protein
MINWRCIKDVGYPTNTKLKYLVTDGTDISTSDIDVAKDYNTMEIRYIKWTGDDNTWENNQCCSGERIFDLKPTHWIPLNELNLPTI